MEKRIKLDKEEEGVPKNQVTLALKVYPYGVGTTQRWSYDIPELSYCMYSPVNRNIQDDNNAGIPLSGQETNDLTKSFSLSIQHINAVIAEEYMKRIANLRAPQSPDVDYAKLMIDVLGDWSPVGITSSKPVDEVIQQAVELGRFRAMNFFQVTGDVGPNLWMGTACGNDYLYLVYKYIKITPGYRFHFGTRDAQLPITFLPYQQWRGMEHRVPQFVAVTSTRPVLDDRALYGWAPNVPGNAEKENNVTGWIKNPPIKGIPFYVGRCKTNPLFNESRLASTNTYFETPLTNLVMTSKLRPIQLEAKLM